MCGQRGIAGDETGPEDPRVGVREEERDAAAFGSHDVPIPTRQALNEAFAPEAAEIVRYPDGCVGVGPV